MSKIFSCQLVGIYVLSHIYNNNNSIYLLQLGCYPMTAVVLLVNKTINWLLLNLSREGYMRSMQWQLGVQGTISAFGYRHRETKKNPCRSGRSQDFPNTDFQPVVGHLKYVKCLSLKQYDLFCEKYKKSVCFFK